jgi:hypothetical protein
LTVNFGATYDFEGGALSVGSILRDDGIFQLTGETLGPGALDIGSSGDFKGFGTVSSTVDNEGLIPIRRLADSSRIHESVTA